MRTLSCSADVADEVTLDLRFEGTAKGRVGNREVDRTTAAGCLQEEAL